MKPKMTAEEARREVEAFRDSLDKPVDRKIKEFLIGLRRWGVETVMSCEGHYRRGCPFPWVSIKAESLPMAMELLRFRSNLWVVEPKASPRIRTSQGGRLRLPFLKRKVEDFGIFLQEIPDNHFELEGLAC